MSQLTSGQSPLAKGRLKFYARLLKPTAATALLLACFSSDADAQRRINPVPPVGWTEHPEVVYPSAYRRTVQAVPTVQRIYMWPQYWPGIPYQTQAECPAYGNGYPVTMEDPAMQGAPHAPVNAAPHSAPQPMPAEQPTPAQPKTGASLTIPPVPGHMPVSYPATMPRELPSQYLTPLDGSTSAPGPQLAPVIRSTSAQSPQGQSILEHRSEVQPQTLPASTLNFSNILATPIGFRTQPVEPGCGDPVEQ